MENVFSSRCSRCLQAAAAHFFIHFFSFFSLSVFFVSLCVSVFLSASVFVFFCLSFWVSVCQLFSLFLSLCPSFFLPLCFCLYVRVSVSFSFFLCFCLSFCRYVFVLFCLSVFCLSAFASFFQSFWFYLSVSFSPSLCSSRVTDFPPELHISPTVFPQMTGETRLKLLWFRSSSFLRRLPAFLGRAGGPDNGRWFCRKGGEGVARRPVDVGAQRGLSGCGALWAPGGTRWRGDSRKGLKCSECFTTGLISTAASG